MKLDKLILTLLEMENQFQVDCRSKHKNGDENSRAFAVKKYIYIYPYGLGLRKRSLKHSTKSDNH